MELMSQPIVKLQLKIHFLFISYQAFHELSLENLDQFVNAAYFRVIAIAK
jgi:hypothetical protein